MSAVSAPTLLALPRTRVVRTRRLALDGEILVRLGDRVAASTVVARADVPGPIHSVNVAAILRIPRAAVPAAVCVSQGDPVEPGQVLANTSALFGLWRQTVVAPVGGVVESISGVSGQLLVRAASRPVQLEAYLDGRVAAVFERSGVEVEAEASIVQGIFGLGAETRGELACVGGDAARPLEACDIGDDRKGRVLVWGGAVGWEALERARTVGAAALVAASASGDALVRFAGGRINPAATGDEDLGLTVVLTEGFGAMRMSQRAARVLSALEGACVSVRGATQVRAGVVRPEVVGPPVDMEPACRPRTAGVIAIGDVVRIVRGAAFGEQATVTAIPNGPARIGSGSTALVYEVRLDDGRTALVPRANVEP